MVLQSNDTKQKEKKNRAEIKFQGYLRDSMTDGAVPSIEP